MYFLWLCDIIIAYWIMNLVDSPKEICIWSRKGVYIV